MKENKLVSTSLSKSWHADPLFSQLIVESWLMNGHSLTWDDHLGFKISNVIIFTGPLIEGKLYSADEFAYSEMGHGSRWPSKKQKITLELVALSPGFHNWTLLHESVNDQIRSGKCGVSGKVIKKSNELSKNNILILNHHILKYEYKINAEG